MIRELKKNLNTDKKKYSHPVIECTYISLEQGLLTTSVSFAPGGQNNQPTVEDWVEKPSTAPSDPWVFDSF